MSFTVIGENKKSFFVELESGYQVCISKSDKETIDKLQRERRSVDRRVRP